MAISFNVEPFWDDFNTAGADGLTPKEKYQRILFRPGKAVQARELTQLQTSLQNLKLYHNHHTLLSLAIQYDF